MTKIKRRFSGDPTTYRQFLEILHSYQKQKESIKDVLDKVSVLFQDHPDLLVDFTYFLPDAVQDQAKERLSRAAARSRSRKAALRQDAEAAREADRAGSRARYSRYIEDRMRSESARHQQLLADRAFERERDTQLLGFGPGRTARGQEVARRRREAEDEMHLQLPPTEQALFLSIKVSLTRLQWLTFLKCLDMFTRDIVTTQELLLLLADLFTDRHAHLLQDLRVLLESRGGVELSAQDAWFTMPVSEIDFSDCESCTPSYRALPKGYPLSACSARAGWENAVLNDVWVSVPTGSEDFSFKHMRRNQYEEALFRCEDEMFEVDMAIENDCSAVRALQPLADEIEALAAVPNFEWHFRLDRRCLGVLHLKAIARVYGEFGGEVLELLKKNPGGAIPIILKRLKQKDQEWRRARLELVKVWKDTQAKNDSKSLDHRSFYFRTSDKRALSQKGLLADVKKRVEEVAAAAERHPVSPSEAVPVSEDADEQAAAAAQEAALQAQVVRSDSGEVLRIEPTLHFLIKDTRLYGDAAAVLAYAVEQLPEPHRPRAAAVWRNFISPFLGIKADDLGARAAGLASPLGPHRIGDSVQTPYGTGIVTDARLASHSPRGAGGLMEAPAEVRPLLKDSDVSLDDPVLYTVLLQWGSVVIQAAQVAAASSAPAAAAGGQSVQQAGSRIGQAPPGHPAASFEGKVRPTSTVTPPGALAPGPVSGRDGSSMVAAHATGSENAEQAMAAAATAGGVRVAVEASRAEHDVARVAVPFASMEAELRAALEAAGPPKSSAVVYTSATEYAFFRMLHILCERLARAKALCEQAAKRPQAGAGAHIEERALAAAAEPGMDLAAAADAVLAGGAGGADEEGEGASGMSAEETYQHFLTALYAAIDGSSDGGKYEDECRTLMGTGSYVLFTMDRLAALAGKQLVAMTTDQTAVKLRGLYEYNAARVALAEASLPPAEAARERLLAARTYRANVAALASTVQEDVFAVQYVKEDPRVVRTARSVAYRAGLRRERGGVAGGAALVDPTAPQDSDEYTATLSIQYFGRGGVFAEELPHATLGLINPAVPVSVSRTVGEGTTLLARASAPAEDEAEEAAADRAGAAAAAAARKPFLQRTVGDVPAAVVQNNMSSVASKAGGLVAMSGGEDVVLRGGGAPADSEGDVQLAK